MNIKDLPSVRDRLIPGILSSNKVIVDWRRWDRATIARWIGIIIVVTVAVGLRVWGLNQLGYNTDEAVYAGQAAAIAKDPTLKDIFPIFRAHLVRRVRRGVGVFPAHELVVELTTWAWVVTPPARLVGV